MSDESVRRSIRVREIGAAVTAYGLARWATPRVGRALASWGLVSRGVRGRTLPLGVGVVPALAAPLAALALGPQTGGARGYVQSPAPVALVALLAGAADDAAKASRGAPRGFRAHWRSLLEGKPSTGVLKAAAVVTGASACALRRRRELGGWRSLAAVLSAALGANLINQLDTRPGRAGVAFISLSAAVLSMAHATAREDRARPLALFAAAVAGYLPWDRREVVMMGDAGANALGAALGYVAAEALDGPDLAAWIALSAGANLALDRWSLSRFLDGSAPHGEGRMSLRGEAFPARPAPGARSREGKEPATSDPGADGHGSAGSRGAHRPFARPAVRVPGRAAGDGGGGRRPSP